MHFISSNGSSNASCDRRRLSSPSLSTVAMCTVRWTDWLADRLASVPIAHLHQPLHVGRDAVVHPGVLVEVAVARSLSPGGAKYTHWLMRDESRYLDHLYETFAPNWCRRWHTDVVGLTESIGLIEQIAHLTRSAD